MRLKSKCDLKVVHRPQCLKAKNLTEKWVVNKQRAEKDPLNTRPQHHLILPNQNEQMPNKGNLSGPPKTSNKTLSQNDNNKLVNNHHIARTALHQMQNKT